MPLDQKDLALKWQKRVLDYRIQNPLEFQDMGIQSIGIFKYGFIITFEDNKRFEINYEIEERQIILSIYTPNYRCIMGEFNSITDEITFKDTVSGNRILLAKKPVRQYNEFFWVSERIRILFKLGILKKVKPNYTWYIQAKAYI